MVKLNLHAIFGFKKQLEANWALFKVLEMQFLGSMTNPTPKLEGQMELKPLPSNLKYTFLGTSETYPMVISTELYKEQEVRLVSMLGKYKKHFG